MTADLLRQAGLDPQALAHPHLMLDDSRPGFRPGHHDVCLMRGGVVFADRVTTVSPTYACEVYRPEFGFGMQVRRGDACVGGDGVHGWVGEFVGLFWVGGGQEVHEWVHGWLEMGGGAYGVAPVMSERPNSFQDLALCDGDGLANQTVL